MPNLSFSVEECLLVGRSDLYVVMSLYIRKAGAGSRIHQRATLANRVVSWRAGAASAKAFALG